MCDCVLPCSFQPGSEEVIHWLKPEDKDLTVHSYYYSRDQLKQQSQPYRGRTALFNDQIPKGNASLLLRGLTLQDQGRYKCYTSTIKGNKESFINIAVEGTEYVHVTCLFSEDCVLPCSFQPDSEEVIHWHKLEDKVPASQGLTVHSYYYSRDQLKQQNQPYRGRTALFNDQIPKGNASLLLRGLTLQDQGRYKCYTSTINGNKESFINITVEGTEHLSVYDDHFMAAPCVMSTLLQLQSAWWTYITGSHSTKKNANLYFPGRIAVIVAAAATAVTILVVKCYLLKGKL
uniref:HERV-H LTR-associating 2b, tandem duplicate 1 n=1 Tax=Hucho hucho TaxID=62062 RepID=A0A4W5MWE4_9TELE